MLYVLGDYLRELQRRRPGALILGCTHYPLLMKAIARLMGPDVPLVESGLSVALEVKRRLAAKGMANRRTIGGRLRCFTTDNPGRFARLSERFGGRKIDDVAVIGTDELKGPATATSRQ